MTAMCYMHNYNDTILTTIYTDFGLKRENMGEKLNLTRNIFLTLVKGLNL